MGRRPTPPDRDQCYAFIPCPNPQPQGRFELGAWERAAASHVPQHVPGGLPVYPLQHRVQQIDACIFWRPKIDRLTYPQIYRSKPLQIWDSKGACVPVRRMDRMNTPNLHKPKSPIHKLSSNLPTTVQNGHIQRIMDEDIQSSVLEIVGTNVSTNYIHCPGDTKKTLGIRLPYLVFILKNVCPSVRLLMCLSLTVYTRTGPDPPLNNNPNHAARQVLHIRGAGARRQEHPPPIPRLHLPGPIASDMARSTTFICLM